MIYFTEYREKIGLPITVRSPDSVRSEIPESPMLNIWWTHLGFEPRTSCVQSRRSTSELMAHNIYIFLNNDRISAFEILT